MLDTEEFKSWLESRRLIISQLSTMDTAIRELDSRIDRYNEVSREKTLELENKSAAAIADLRARLTARGLQVQWWSGVIGLVAGGVAAVIIHLLANHVTQ